jgi:exodeoxyribonuclease VII small subunit
MASTKLRASASLKVFMSNKLTADGVTAPESFEQAMAELAQLVAQMEAGQLPLEASVAAYARGSELVRYCVRYCAAQLEKVEAQVKVLEGDMLKPFAAANGGEGDQ